MSAWARTIPCLRSPTARSHSATASSAASTCILCRLAEAKHRNGQNGTVPTRGRPGFPEDAPALAIAIADEAIVRNLAVVPWPYTLRDAEAFLASPRDPVLPSLLIFKRTAGAPQLVGSCGLGRRPSGPVEMGYWIAR